MDIKVVLGLGFGDEGKGATVNSLIVDPNKTLIVRFNGGHQVGHTVVYNDIRHTFSNFGSGSLKGSPTYITEYCTVDPISLEYEGKALHKQGVEPIVYFNANAMITTPYDRFSNIFDVKNIHHGSVGVGFGKTIERNESNYKLYVRDLFYPKIRDLKLKLISDIYYDKQFNDINDLLIEKFKECCDVFIRKYNVVNTLNEVIHKLSISNLIFEGGQGIMLDKDYGFFPNVTRSNTTSKNVMSILGENELLNENIITYYVTRAYQTRHGNGFLINSEFGDDFIEKNPYETNVNGGTQGEFRRAMLDLDQLRYALNCDSYHNKCNNKKIVFTCLDHVPSDIPIVCNGESKCMKVEDIVELLNINEYYCSYSDKGFVI